MKAMEIGPLKDQVIFIQGAGRWPGPALVKAFGGAGAKVAAVDLAPSLLDPLENEAQAAGWEVRAYIGDTSRGMPARALVDEVLADFNRIDVLVNNPRVISTTPLMDTDDYDWLHVLDVNLNGPFLLTRLIGRMMREQGGGVVLNLVSGTEAEGSTASSAASAASQAGLLALSTASARELIAYNIRVAALCWQDAASETPGGAPAPHGRLVEVALALCIPGSTQPAGQVFQVECPARP